MLDAGNTDRNSRFERLRMADVLRRSRASGCVRKLCWVAQLGRPPVGSQRRPNKASAACGPLGSRYQTPLQVWAAIKTPAPRKPKDIPGCQVPLTLRAPRLRVHERRASADAVPTLSLPRPKLRQYPACLPRRVESTNDAHDCHTYTLVHRRPVSRTLIALPPELRFSSKSTCFMLT